MTCLSDIFERIESDPERFPEKLIPLIILNIVEEKPLPIYGDGKNVRDWISVIDHCDALITVLKKGIPGEIYNIGGGAEREDIEIVHLPRICYRVSFFG